MKQTNGSKAMYIKWLRFIPAVLWMTVIYLLSARTGDEIGTMLPFFQKFLPFMNSFNWGHFVAYFILAATLDYGLGARADRIGWKIVIVMLCGIYGVTDEFHQSFVGGRMPDVLDIRNDMIGAALWTIIVSIRPIRNLWRKRAL